MDTIGTDPKTQSAIDILQSHVFFRPREAHGWKSLPELPTADEVLATRSKLELEKLPHNPVDIPWESKEEYLAAQYEILRCEAVEGLRFSVRSFAENPRRMNDDDHTCIYTKVRVKEYLMSTIGPIARVFFSTERSEFRIQWLQSKRLQPGTLVALSTNDDNFNKICKIATVAQRPYNDGLDQDPPIVDLLWAKPEDAVLDPDLEMVMIESRHGYFESARHALVGLQQAAQTESPIDKYLTGIHTKDKSPEFLKEDPVIDLSSLAHHATEKDLQALMDLKTYDIRGELPELQGLTFLDESQLLGLHRIVSKELAIVQGPPGTGKTFTSVEALKVLVANRRRHRGPPIVVAAQTNHALDQILAHCINAGANVLRIGGRTQHELIKPYTLFELRQRSKIAADRKCSSVDHQRRENTRKIKELVDSLFGDQLLDPAALLNAGIITEAQYLSLCDDTMETHAAVAAHGPFALWLGDNLIPAHILRDRHPTQLERSEAEARKNLPEWECDDEEMENIADDEEDLYRFQGERIKLEHVWSGKSPAGLTSWKRAVARALRHNNLFDVEPGLRGAVYQYFQAKLLEAITPQFATLLAENIRLCKTRKAFKFLGNVELLEKQRIDIVGCTTTGLSKYRGCIAAMQPRSLLIEEAAETREANIVSALYPSVQQLILVGDHQQLAPKCDIQWLGEAPFNLNVSLFQRLVNLDMPFVMLNQQRRMKPELRQILNPFYPDLVDHPSVQSINARPDIPGMDGKNCWLFDHTWPEDMTSDFSKFNEQEAEMITHFFAYLVSNCTPAEKITVLTFYKGQRKLLLNKLKRHPSIMGSTFNVCTVDSYQGEENDVILLSLVRSPQPDRSYAVGFLEDERRAVVAISRARRGFYIFGNVDNILRAHDASFNLWSRICSGFVRQDRVQRDMGIPLTCQTHNRRIWIKEVADWGDNSGGCDLPCDETRPCGHPCTLRCHVISHDQLMCSQPCRESLGCGHGCQKLCGQECFCDCKEFRELKGQNSIAASKQPSLVERMIQMGAEPSEMLMAAENYRGASHQQGQSDPALSGAGQHSGPGQPASTRASRRARTNATQVPSPTVSRDQESEAAARWSQFVGNIRQHDEEMLRESVSGAGQGTPETTIREVYQPTALAQGRRADAGGRTVQQVRLATDRPAPSPAVSRAPSATVLIPGLESGVVNFSLANEPIPVSQRMPPASSRSTGTPISSTNSIGGVSTQHGPSRRGKRGAGKVSQTPAMSNPNPEPSAPSGWVQYVPNEPKGPKSFADYQAERQRARLALQAQSRPIAGEPVRQQPAPRRKDPPVQQTVVSQASSTERVQSQEEEDKDGWLIDLSDP